MAAPTTLLEYTQQQRDAHDNERQEVAKQLDAAQKQAASARDTLTKATAAFADLEKSEATIRKQLSAIPTPADGDAFIDQLQRTIIAKRAQQAKLLDADLALGIAEARRDTLAGELARATAALTDATAKLDQAKERTARRKEQQDTLGKAPLSTLPADAEKALKETPFTNAQKRLADDLPTDLLQRARDRRQFEVFRFAAVTKWATKAAGQAAAGTDLGRLWGELQNAEDALQVYISSAKERYDRALALLERVADPNNDPLTDDERARIQTLAAQGTTAVTEETKLDAKVTAVVLKEGALTNAVLAAEANNIDRTIDPVTGAGAQVPAAQNAADTADTTVTAKTKVRDDAQADLQTKQAAFDKAVGDAQANNVDPKTDATAVAAEAARDAAQNVLTDAESALTTAKREQADAHVALDATKAAAAVETADQDLTAARGERDTAVAAWNEKETKRDDAAKDVQKKTDALAKAIDEAKAKKVDPMTDAAVTAADNDLKSAKSTLAAAEDEYKKSFKGIIHIWEAAVPDSTWRLFADFETAQRLLHNLADDDPASLAQQVDAAEANVLDALCASDARDRSLHLLAVEASTRATRLALETRAAPARALYALRGEGFWGNSF